MRALLIEKGTPGTVTTVDESKLPDRAVTVRVSHSTLNYKDGLAITGKGPVVRNFPMVAGIDLVGTVETSSDPRWNAGDAVLVNGFGLGELHWGGLAWRLAQWPESGSPEARRRRCCRGWWRLDGCLC